MSNKFEQVIKDYGGLLSRVASTYEANDSVKQELYQEICVAVWQGLLNFKEQASLKTYILRIAHNRCVTHVTKESKLPKGASFDDADNCTMDEADLAAANSIANFDTASSIEASLIQSQKLNKLLTAVRKLKLPARQIITLSMEGLSYQEIAEVTGLTVTNIGVSITRIKKELQRQLQDEK